MRGLGGARHGSGKGDEPLLAPGWRTVPHPSGSAGFLTSRILHCARRADESAERGATWGWSLGVAEGLGRMVTRHLVGVWELVMAPFPLPKGYAPILEPEFPWDYFQDWD